MKHLAEETSTEVLVDETPDDTGEPVARRDLFAETPVVHEPVAEEPVDGVSMLEQNIDRRT